MSRVNYQKLAPQATQALVALDKTLEGSTLGQTLMDLIKIRASQINGCLFCLDMFSKEAKLHGEREIRLYHLPLWQESALFSEKEKAALEWTEILTAPDSQGASDEDYEQLANTFKEKEIADLTMAIIAINAWNRLGIAFRPTPGQLDKIAGLEKAGLN